ncbi:hypothetical protein K9L27_04190 [Candidatus Gracilibacteria bacterium]|nr:hypothetical protein [Candidatus Gracilibacteria bacterium]
MVSESKGFSEQLGTPPIQGEIEKVGDVFSACECPRKNDLTGTFLVSGLSFPVFLIKCKNASRIKPGEVPLCHINAEIIKECVFSVIRANSDAEINVRVGAE